MEKPTGEIDRVIQHLTQGTYREVDAAIDEFFVRDAAFVHPFVRVPRFSFDLPGVGNVNSRMIIHAIYRWYRFLSPQTQVAIASSAFDDANNILYVSIAQRFAIWFIPLYAAHVRLVTVLHLSSYQVNHDANGNPVDPGNNTRYRITQQHDHYQVNDWLNFILPGFGGYLCGILQFLCSALCVLLALMSTVITMGLAFLMPFGWPFSPSTLVTTSA